MLGVFLLNYAQDRAQLLALCRAIERHLKPSGRFIGLNSNMELDPARFGDYQKYGVAYFAREDRVEGDPFRVQLTNADGSVAEFKNYYLSHRTYAEVVAEAGLQDLEWKTPWVSDAGRLAFPDGFWDAFLDAPPQLAIQARKPA